jgi:hypothetical protein
MSDIIKRAGEPREIPGLVCVCVGIGFIGGLVALIVLVRLLSGT